MIILASSKNLSTLGIKKTDPRWGRVSGTLAKIKLLS